MANRRIAVEGTVCNVDFYVKTAQTFLKLFDVYKQMIVSPCVHQIPQSSEIDHGCSSCRFDTIISDDFKYRECACPTTETQILYLNSQIASSESVATREPR